jgi:predicted enzyme related to lactoylglutathione lyase
MKVEKLDKVVVTVRNLEQAKKFFGELFETTFIEIGEVKQGISGVVARPAITPFGLELLQRIAPPSKKFGITAFHLKVKDIEAVRSELAQKGYDPVAEIEIKRVKELVYEVEGVRIAFVEYQGDSFGLA